MSVLIILIAIGVGILFTSSQQLGSSTTAPVAPSQTLPQVIPGVPSSLYRNDSLGFTIAYPSATPTPTDPSPTALQTSGFEGYLSVTQTPVVGFPLPMSLMSGTNLGEAGVYIGATTSPAVVAKCTQTSTAAGETSAGDMVVDGASFTVTTSTGVGAGNTYEMISYRTVHNDACIEVVELLHSLNIANYPPGTVSEFDRAKFSGILDNLVQTFVLIK